MLTAGIPTVIASAAEGVVAAVTDAVSVAVIAAAAAASNGAWMVSCAVVQACRIFWFVAYLCCCRFVL